MAAPKGHKRYGGRSVGAPNKITLDLIKTLQTEGFDPAAELVRTHALAMIEFERQAEIHDAIQEKRASLEMVPINHGEGAAYLSIAQNACKDLMRYCYPQRKAVELTGKDGADVFESFTQMMKRLADSKKQ